MKIENFNVAPGANVNIISDSQVTIQREEKPQITQKDNIQEIQSGDIIEEAEAIDEIEQEIISKGMPFFEEAIEEGLMIKTPTGFEWKLSKVLLSYFCGRIYCGDFVKKNTFGDAQWKTEANGNFPDKILSKLFDSPNLGASRRKQLLGTAPTGYKKIDVLFG